MLEKNLHYLIFSCFSSVMLHLFFFFPNQWWELDRLHIGAVFNAHHLHWSSPGFTPGPPCFSFLILVFGSCVTSHSFSCCSETATLYLCSQSSDSWEYDTWGLRKFHLSWAEFVCSHLPDISSRMLVHRLKFNLDKTVLLFLCFSKPVQDLPINTDNAAVT